MKKIIIIGNSPSVLEKKAGRLVDEFDYVCRINNFETYNFEKFVGTKTNYWVVNANHTIKEKNTNNFLEIIVPINDEIINDFIKKSFLNGKNLSFITKEKCDFYKKRYNCDSKLSSGLLSIFYFLEKKFLVFIHGINGFKNIKNNESIHYFKDEITTKKIFHNIEQESRIIENLLFEKKIYKITQTKIL